MSPRRIVNTANPLGQAKAYNYDKMSRVTEIKDPAGNITSYTYDALNRLTKKDIQTTAGIHSITDYTYDAVGNLLNIANGESSVSYTYDQLNRPITTSQAFAGKTYPITYSYDAVGNRVSMTTPWGKYSYTYDALNRLTSILNPQGITAAFTYDAVGRRTSKKIFKATPELLAEADYTYDAAGELLSITNKADNKVVAFANYEYDAAGNRIKKEDQNGVEKYRYDAANRLITAEPVPFDMAKAEGFVYDRNGNRRFDRGAKDYKYDAANRVLSNSVYTYTHDANGNLTSRTEIASSATITYAYNPEQQLSEVTTPKDNLAYKYDPLGRRTEKTVNGISDRYVYDNEDIIAILDSNSNLAETFTHGPGIDEPLLMTKADGNNYYYHADGLGSIVTLTDEKGQVLETYAYKSYGYATIKDQKGAIFDKSNISNPYFFTARELEDASGLYYLRHRYYDWNRGAFTQEDPIGFVGIDLNLYSYVLDNPILLLDPFGLHALIFDGKILQYFNDEMRLVGTYNATSGAINVTDRTLKGKGPIPFGLYLLYPSEISKTNFIRKFLGDWGEYRVPLHPTSGTDTFGRGGFFLHGGKRPGSAGCVDVGAQDIELFPKLITHESPILLISK